MHLNIPLGVVEVGWWTQRGVFLQFRFFNAHGIALSPLTAPFQGFHFSQRPQALQNVAGPAGQVREGLPLPWGPASQPREPSSLEETSKGS